MSSTSWRGQVYRALQLIDCLGHSKYEAKQAQGWQPGQPIHGLYSFGYKNLVFDRAITFTNWLRDQYPHVRLFQDVDGEMTAEYLNEKAETCTPDTLRTTLATLKKLQEGLYAMNWIHEDIIPADWPIEGRNPPRGPYAPLEAQAISQRVAARSAEYGQALRFILSSGARINEALQLRADKVFLADGQVALLGEGGWMFWSRLNSATDFWVLTRAGLCYRILKMLPEMIPIMIPQIPQRLLIWRCLSRMPSNVIH